MKKIVMVLIKFYQKAISPMMPPSCRFHPTCSNYGLEAVETHGALKGAWLTVLRISKCHPFHKGGFDPVPPKKNNKTKKVQ